MTPQKLKTASRELAYNKYTAKNDNARSVIFLSGFMSDMEGAKALFLQAFCEENDISFVRFDYSGTGLSEGDIKDGTISRWKEDSLNIIHELGAERNILVGSSMGAWLMLLIAMEIPEKTESLIGIAAAPDFTEKLIWDTLGEEAKNQLTGTGEYQLPTEYCNSPGQNSSYTIYKTLIEDGRGHLLFNRHGKLDITVPATFIHGIDDLDVPYHFSMDIAEKIASDDVEVILKKGSGHRMSSMPDLTLLKQVLKKHII